MMSIADEMFRNVFRTDLFDNEGFTVRLGSVGLHLFSHIKNDYRLIINDYYQTWTEVYFYRTFYFTDLICIRTILSNKLFFDKMDTIQEDQNQFPKVSSEVFY